MADLSPFLSSAAGLARELLALTGRKEHNVPIINIALVLIVVGVLMWLVNTYIPMARSIKSILNAVVVIAVVVWVLKVSGVWPDLEQYRLPH